MTYNFMYWTHRLPYRVFPNAPLQLKRGEFSAIRNVMFSVAYAALVVDMVKEQVSVPFRWVIGGAVLGATLFGSMRLQRALDPAKAAPAKVGEDPSR